MAIRIFCIRLQYYHKRCFLRLEYFWNRQKHVPIKKTARLFWTARLLLLKNSVGFLVIVSLIRLMGQYLQQSDDGDLCGQVDGLIVRIRTRNFRHIIGNIKIGHLGNNRMLIVGDAQNFGTIPSEILDLLDDLRRFSRNRKYHDKRRIQATCRHRNKGISNGIGIELQI